MEPAVFFAGNKKCFKTCCPLLCSSDYHISFCSWHFLFPCSFLHFDTAFMYTISVLIQCLFCQMNLFLYDSLFSAPKKVPPYHAPSLFLPEISLFHKSYTELFFFIIFCLSIRLSFSFLQKTLLCCHL